MSEVRVRRARDADVAAVATVVSDAFAPFVARTGIVPEPVRTDWPTVVSAAGARVAVSGERVVGVLVVWPHPDHLLLELVAVAPDVRGSGVGRILMDHAEREARDLELPAIRLYTNAAMTDAVAYHGRRGYAETGRRTEHGYSRVFFEKRVGPR